MFVGHSFELILIFVAALLIFGPKKLPEMGSAIGKSIKEFRKGMNELTGTKEEKEPLPMNLEAIDSVVPGKKINYDYSETNDGTPEANETRPTKGEVE